MEVKKKLRSSENNDKKFPNNYPRDSSCHGYLLNEMHIMTCFISDCAYFSDNKP